MQLGRPRAPACDLARVSVEVGLWAAGRVRASLGLLPAQLCIAGKGVGSGMEARFQQVLALPRPQLLSL